MTVRKFDRLDEVRIRVLYGNHPSEPPTSAFLLIMPGSKLVGRSVDDDRLVADLRPLFVDKGLIRSREIPHELSVHKTHASWGADSAGMELLLYVLQHTSDAVIAAGVVAAFDRIRAGLGSGPEPAFAHSAQELREYADWSVHEVYRDWLDPDVDLEFISESRSDLEWTGEFHDGAGTHFVVVLRSEGGEPHRVRISRTAPDS